VVFQRSYSTGHFELQLDGHVTTAYLRSVDGGYPRASVVEEAFGAAHHRARHLATADIEPITLELGLSGARDVLHWIRASWRREIDRRSGQISHADFDLRATLDHEFTDALITETTFPTLDGSAKEPAYLKCKLQPERIAIRAAPVGRRVRAADTPHQKRWTPAAFRLVLDGIAGVERVARIESFAIKQNVKMLRVGAHRDVQLEPTRVDFPALTCTLALADAGGVLAWYERSVVADRATAVETTGAIELLTPDRAATLLRLDLYEVGIHHLQVAASTANADAIKRVKFELHVGRMDLAA
jgi:hypothetical protein